MEKFTLSETIKVDFIEKIQHEVRAAIQNTKRQHNLFDGLKVAMPKYLKQAMDYNLNSLIPSKSLPSKTIYGCEIVLNYDNTIVVYHEDMPYLNIDPIKIDLKKAP